MNNNRHLLVCSEDCLSRLLEDLSEAKCNLLNIEKRCILNYCCDYYVVYEGDLEGWEIDDDIYEEDLEYLNDEGYASIEEYVNDVSEYDIDDYYGDEKKLVERAFYKNNLIVNGKQCKIKKIR